MTTSRKSPGRKEAPVTTSPIAHQPASETSLDHYESRCECGLEMRNTFRQSLELDVAGHLAWHERAGR